VEFGSDFQFSALGREAISMQVFNLLAQQEFDPERHVEYSAPPGKAMSPWHAGSRAKSAPIIVIQVQRRSISASRAEAQ